MHPHIFETISGTRRYGCCVSDCIDFFAALPDDCIDLIVTSPPYEDARTYEDGRTGKVTRAGQDWVDWMVALVRAASRCCRGPIFINCEGRTEDYKYTMTPFLLMTDLHRAGFNMRKPFVFNRVGIPGSGGPDWLRNDWEPVIAITRPGRAPWSDPLACGHKPKWAPGGEMSHRMTDGSRKNDAGSKKLSDKPKLGISLFGEDPEPETPASKNAHGIDTGRPVGSRPYGNKADRPTETYRAKNFRHAADGTVKGEHDRDICAIANPGNVLKFLVGGNLMGHKLAHENEAPYPLGLPTALTMMYCPLDGIVCDPFSGSGTTLHAAFEQGRRFIGCDDRQSQVDLAYRRGKSITPSMLNLIPQAIIDDFDAEVLAMIEQEL